VSRRSTHLAYVSTPISRFERAPLAEVETVNPSRIRIYELIASVPKGQHMSRRSTHLAYVSTAAHRRTSFSLSVVEKANPSRIRIYVRTRTKAQDGRTVSRRPTHLAYVSTPPQGHALLHDRAVEKANPSRIRIYGSTKIFNNYVIYPASLRAAANLAAFALPIRFARAHFDTLLSCCFVELSSSRAPTIILASPGRSR
jgi:hypothetical protein